MSSKFRNCLVLYLMHAQHNRVMILMFPRTIEKFKNLHMKSLVNKSLNTCRCGGNLSTVLHSMATKSDVLQDCFRDNITATYVDIC